MSQLNRELVLGFVTEAVGYLPAIRSGLAEFRENQTDGMMLYEPFRCVHIIKGASSMVGLSELSHVAFALEEVLELLMHEPNQATPALLVGMVTTIDHIETYLAGVTAGADQQPEFAALALQHARQLRGLTALDTDLPPVIISPSDLSIEVSTGGPPVPDDASSAPTPASDSAQDPAADPIALVDFPPVTQSELTPGAPPTSSAVSPELLAVFRLESEDHIRTLATLLPEVRANPTDNQRWQAIRRAAHSLKGTAGLVGLHQVTQLAHRMEDLLDLYFEGRNATFEEIDLLIAGADLIAETVEGQTTPAGFSDLHTRLTQVLGEVSPVVVEKPADEAPTAPAEPTQAPQIAAQSAQESAESFVRVPIRRLDEIAKLVGELVIARTALEQRVTEFVRLLAEARPATERLGRVTDRLGIGFEASALAGSRTAGAFAHAGGDGPTGSDGFDDLELDRYTEFHLLTRELTETTTDVQTVFGEFGHLLAEFDGQLTRQARLASEAEDKLMRLRMVPLATVVAKLHRTVRTAARTATKQAELLVEGERTGLDKTVLEAMSDPLLHLIRNAVDHGLEPTEVRLALGKAASGTIALRAAHEGNHVVLTISDDGRGIDFEQVREAIVRRGLVTADEANGLSEEELLEFLFRPGFSTRDEISELSGRGVGLDVVKTKVEALKGTVTVTSTLGRGTIFTIRLPMTLAVVRALLVRAGDQTYAVPLEAVEQILRPKETDLDRVGRELVLRVGDSVCPLVPLTRIFGLRQSADSEATRSPVVVLKVAGRRTAVAVDQLVGGREVVVKSLGQQLRRLPGVSGATLLGDGSVVLILNPAGLIRGTSAPVSRPTSGAPASPVRGKDGFSVLVVDDSPSVRRVLTTLLAGTGWQVILAKDGLEALEVLQRGGTLPDVVLTDVEMPRMDGYELLATVRADTHLARLPVAVLTSRSADKHRLKALGLGASAYVVKPYQDQNLLDILRQVIRSAQTAAPGSPSHDPR
jgi:chemosensory pili system protein ChpA (sensor histidine kinase/response regulator)